MQSMGIGKFLMLVVLLADLSAARTGISVSIAHRVSMCSYILGDDIVERFPCPIERVFVQERVAPKTGARTRMTATACARQVVGVDLQDFPDNIPACFLILNDWGWTIHVTESGKSSGTLL